MTGPMILRAALSIAFLVAGTIWVYVYDGYCEIDKFSSGNRELVYRVSVSLFGSLLGFSLTVTSIILGYANSDRMSIIRKSSQYPKLGRILISTVISSGCVAIISLVCLIFDRDKDPIYFLTLLFILLVIWAVERMVASIWLVNKIVTLITIPEG